VRSEGAPKGQMRALGPWVFNGVRAAHRLRSFKVVRIAPNLDCDTQRLALRVLAYRLLRSSGSLVMFAEIRRASSREDWKQKHGAGVFRLGPLGEDHEAFASHRGRIHSYGLH
jgi:hypothetical protein